MRADVFDIISLLDAGLAFRDFQPYDASSYAFARLAGSTDIDYAMKPLSGQPAVPPAARATPLFSRAAVT